MQHAHHLGSYNFGEIDQKRPDGYPAQRVDLVVARMDDIIMSVERSVPGRRFG